MVFKTLALAKVPLGEVQVPPVAGSVTLPAKVTAELLAQTFWFGPAFTVGAAVIVKTIVELTGLQVPCAVELIVKVTVPAVLSAAEGV